MGATNIVSTLSGLFKETYADNLVNLIPESAKVTKLWPFVQRDKELGNLYHQPVVVSNEHGVTFAAAGAGAFALNASVAMSTQDAQINGSQILLRSQMDYEAAAKASSGGKKAFRKGTELLVENMMESMTKYLETAIVYGGSGLGQTTSSANASATSTVVTLTTASFAPGIWAGAENATINFYTAVPALVSSSADAVFTITSVDVDARTITVSGTSTGISALDTAIAGGTCSIWWNGAYGAEMSGLDKIITNTGTLFNISAATYNLWKGNSYSAGNAALTIGKLLAAVGKGVNRGLDEKATVLLNPSTWGNLMSDLSALRRFDGSYDRRKLESGASAITFYSQNGELDLVSYNLIKEGEGYIIPTKRVKRIGATDVTFNTPGMEENEFFRQMDGYAGFELRSYTDQAVFLETPARAVKLTAIVNS